jgi:nucleotidyltransferase substrate binding protein (TIGR01987 family)
VRWFSVPRPPCDYDYVQGVPHNGSVGGFHLVTSIGDAAPPLSMVAAGRNPRTFGHPGTGGSIGWADPDTRLAVAMTHNRMFRATTPEENPPFELCWKFLKAYLEEQHNAVCTSPRTCFRSAFRHRVIDNDPFWIDLTVLRNYTVHTYNEDLADYVYSRLAE